MKNVLGKYAMLGGSVMLGYQLIHDTLRHHDEANARPMFFDHMYATTIIGTSLGAFAFNTPFAVFCSGFFSMTMVTPALWWLKNAGRMNPVRGGNIFYENGTTPEEVERFRN